MVAPLLTPFPSFTELLLPHDPCHMIRSDCQWQYLAALTWPGHGVGPRGGHVAYASQLELLLGICMRCGLFSKVTSGVV